VPIRPFIGDASFTPEQVMALNDAFNSALAELNLTDRQDPLAEIAAKKIIEIARGGERDPERLRELALNDIRV
jgi:hypothetical protein